MICVGSRTTYLIRDCEGRLIAKHHRIDNPDGSKRVWWEMPDGSKGLNGTPLTDLPLYGSELVEDCHEDELIVATARGSPSRRIRTTLVAMTQIG